VGRSGKTEAHTLAHSGKQLEKRASGTKMNRVVRLPEQDFIFELKRICE